MPYPSVGSWNLVVEDDYAGYADQAAFEAAHPDPYGFDPSGVYDAVWGLTEGPDGVPGVRADDSGNNWPITGDNMLGFFVRSLFTINGREFMVKGTFINTTNYAGLSVQWVDPGESDGDAYINVWAGKSVAGSNFSDMIVQVYTDADHDNITLNLHEQIIAGAWPNTGTHVITIQCLLKDNGDPDEDNGYARVLVDDVEVFLFNGPIFKGAGDTRVMNYVNINPANRFTQLEIYDVVEASTIPIDVSVPCCGSKVDPGETTPGALPPENPFIPLPPWVSVGCEGLGTYLSGSNPTEVESWEL